MSNTAVRSCKNLFTHKIVIETCVINSHIPSVNLDISENRQDEAGFNCWLFLLMSDKSRKLTVDNCLVLRVNVFFFSVETIFPIHIVQESKDNELKIQKVINNPQ